MILTKEQAQAIYSAMCALNSIGAKLNASLYERAQLIRVHEAGGFIRVEVGGLQHEVFESQSVFANAYELLEPSISHLDALETIASGNTDPDRMVELAKEALAASVAEVDMDPVAEVAESFIFFLRKQPNGKRWPRNTKLYVLKGEHKAHPLDTNS